MVDLDNRDQAGTTVNVTLDENHPSTYCFSEFSRA